MSMFITHSYDSNIRPVNAFESMQEITVTKDVVGISDVALNVFSTFLHPPFPHTKL